MTLPTAVTVKNIEKAILTSAQNAVTADVSGWAGLEEVTINQLGAAAAIDLDTKANVKTAAVSKGTTVAITDNGTTDTLATVSLTGNTGAATLISDALTTLSLKEVAGVATVTNTTIGHNLDVTVDKLTAGGVRDDVAATVNITASGTKSSGITLTTDAATTVAFAGDQAISLALADTGGLAGVVTTITSTNTAGVTITSALGNTTAFTGAEGDDSIIISNLNTKATAMGAGDDTVTATGTALGAGGTIDGGAGTDTLQLTAADAETLSANATYEARISNFEKIGLGQVLGGGDNTVNLANLDDISYVVSAGTAASTGTAEVQTIAFGNADVDGGVITVGGVNITIASGALAGDISDAVAAQEAAIIAANADIASVVSDGAGLVTITYTTTSGPQAVITAVQNASGVTFGAVVPADGTDETLDVDTITVGTAPIATGEFTVTINGTAVAVNAVLGQTDAQTAAAIKAALDANVTVAGLVTTSVLGNVVTITGKTGVGAITPVVTADAAIFGGGGADPAAAEGVVNYIAPLPETQTFTVTAGTDADGGEILIGGTRIALAGGLTIDEVGSAIAGSAAAIIANNADITGVNYDTALDTVTVTYLAAAGNVADIVAADNTTSGSAITPNDDVVVGVAGTAAGILEVTKMANGGTLELTNDNAGAITVAMTDATGAADSLNLVLNGAADLWAGDITVAGVETINIETTDSSADDVTVTNPLVPSNIVLNATSATTITVSGNHGLGFWGAGLDKVTTLDASGVVANVNTTGLTEAQIIAANGVAGAVSFTVQVDDKDVTVTTGNGNDWIDAWVVGSAAGKTASATITTGAGADYVIGGADNDTINTGTEIDWVDSSAGADTITLGAGNDRYWLGSTTHSVLAKYDTITDFSANTYGFGTNGAADDQGANIADATKVTGDVIDVSWVFAAAGIEVLVTANAADAQTFIQNVASGGSGNTGFALDSSSSLLYMDMDANGVIDSVIKLTGVTTIDEAAFVI